MQLSLVINQPDIRKAEEEDSPDLDLIDQLVNFQPEKVSVSVTLCHKGRSIVEKKCENNGVLLKAPSLGRENPLDDDRHTKVC